VLHVARCKYRTQKIVKHLPSGHHRTTLSGYILQLGTYRQSEKKLLSTNISSTFHTIWWTSPTSGWDRSGHPDQISTGFASWQRYCSDVAQRKPAKLCTVFGRLLGWYTTYAFSGVLVPLRNLARCKILFASSQVLRCRILVALLHGTWVVGASQSLRRWAQGATYIWQGDHHFGHWPTI